MCVGEDEGTPGIEGALTDGLEAAADDREQTTEREQTTDREQTAHEAEEAGEVRIQMNWNRIEMIDS